MIRGRRPWLWLLLGVSVLGLLAGCGSVGYWLQSAHGHMSVLKAARPVSDLLVDPALDPALRERLVLSQRLRDFASSELKLPDNSSYRRYADLGRPAVVWNVVAAPELSLQLKTWCYPVMGCAAYRGFFQREQADAFAAELRQQGWEVMVYGVPAYSTLGWSNLLGGDPLLNTFIQYGEADLARMIFHELAHQVAYASDDTEFNEAFATAVEQLGGAQWLSTHGSEALRQRDARQQARRESFRALTLRYRDQLQSIYTATLDDDAKRAQKRHIMAALQVEHETLVQGAWAGDRGYARWFSEANNASFAVLAAYHALVPDFVRLFEREGRDWPAFYTRVQALAQQPKLQRRAALQSFTDGGPDGRDPHSP